MTELSGSHECNASPSCVSQTSLLENGKLMLSDLLLTLVAALFKISLWVSREQCVRYSGAKFSIVFPCIVLSTDPISGKNNNCRMTNKCVPHLSGGSSHICELKDMPLC